MSQSIEVYCPSCDRHVPGENINIQEMMGKCNACDAVFPIKSWKPFGEEDVYQPVKSEPSQPSGLHLEEDVNGVFIWFRWFTPGIIFLTFFCIAWDSFLVFWYAAALGGIGQGQPIVWLMVLFPIVHVAVGVSLTYSVLCGYLNRTRIKVDHFEIRVWHGPLPWFGNVQIRCDEIKEIEVISSISNGQSNFGNYTIAAHHVDGRQVKLLKNVTFDRAEFITWHLSQSLNVPSKKKL
ncbi:MAG: hypothetical protein AAFN77_04395 [Planctomycetota bacterium]